MRLHWHPFSIIPRRVRIMVREKGVACDEVLVDLPGGAHRGAEFLRLNPFGQVPVLEDGGLVLTESLPILEYLEERIPSPPLLSTDAVQRAQTRELMQWSNDYLPPAWKAWMAPFFSRDVQRDDPSVARGRADIAAHLDVLEARLGKAAWLVRHYSLADIAYAPIVTVLDYVGLGDLLASRPAVAAWVRRLCDRPAVRDTAPPRPVRDT